MNNFPAWVLIFMKKSYVRKSAAISIQFWYNRKFKRYDCKLTFAPWESLEKSPPEDIDAYTFGKGMAKSEFLEIKDHKFLKKFCEAYLEFIPTGKRHDLVFTPGLFDFWECRKCRTSYHASKWSQEEILKKEWCRETRETECNCF